jgi:chemotaxis protein CheD
MIRSEHSNYGKPMVILYPGEHVVTKEDVILSTVSGSCLVVSLYDRLRHIGGMGHFILPGQIRHKGITEDEVAAYGITQLEYLFGEFVKLGSSRNDVVANIFGAAEQSYIHHVNHSILDSNVNFIHKYFTNEKIPIKNLDLEGHTRRKILFFPASGKTFRKNLKNNETDSEIIKMEQEYIDRAFREVQQKTQVVLFDN